MKHVTAWIVLVTSSGHIFCCVLPTVLGVLNLLASAGIASLFVPAFEQWHESMHVYEEKLLMFSGIMLGIAALADMISIQIDCHKTGCSHGSCQPVKDRATMILLFAAVLFAFNATTYILNHGM